MPNDRNIARSYQQVAARGASPIGIIIQIYDVAIDSLHRAARAIDAGDIQERVNATNKFFAAVTELRAALDYERGGDVARRFGRFYQLARAEILTASMRMDRATYESYAGLFFKLRNAWQTVEPRFSAGEAAPPTPPVSKVRVPQEGPEPGGADWSA